MIEGWKERRVCHKRLVEDIGGGHSATGGGIQCTSPPIVSALNCITCHVSLAGLRPPVAFASRRVRNAKAHGFDNFEGKT